MQQICSQPRQLLLRGAVQLLQLRLPLLLSYDLLLLMFMMVG
jgi:hypothetical protein